MKPGCGFIQTRLFRTGECQSGDMPCASLAQGCRRSGKGGAGRHHVIHQQDRFASNPLFQAWRDHKRIPWIRETRGTVEACLRWRSTSATQRRIHTMAQSSRQRRGNQSGLIETSHQTARPVQRHRHDHLGFWVVVGRLPTSVPRVSLAAELCAQVIQAPKLESSDDHINRWRVAPNREHSIKGRRPSSAGRAVPCRRRLSGYRAPTDRATGAPRP